MFFLNWIFLAVVSAVFFGLGDFIVVYSEHLKMNVVTLYVTYTVMIGLLNLLYLLFIRTDSISEILQFTSVDWSIVVGLCFFYFLAYLLHFVALQKAEN